MLASVAFCISRSSKTTANRMLLRFIFNFNSEDMYTSLTLPQVQFGLSYPRPSCKNPRP